jgi:hypothetical protein
MSLTAGDVGASRRLVMNFVVMNSFFELRCDEQRSDELVQTNS